MPRGAIHWFRVSVSFVMVAVGAICAVAICSPDVRPTDQSFRAFQAFLAAIGLVGWANTLSRTPVSFSSQIKGYAFPLLFGGLSAVSVLHPAQAWLGICVFAAVLAVSVAAEIPPQGPKRSLLAHAFLIWLVIGAWLQIARAFDLDFAKPIIQLAAIHSLLDFRFSLILVLGVVTCAVAAANLHEMAPPSIRSIPTERIPRPDTLRLGGISSILLPLIYAVLLVSRILGYALNAMWVIGATVAVVFARFIRELVKECFRILRQSSLYIAAAEILSLLLLPICLTYLAIWTADPAVRYLRDNTTIGAISSSSVQALTKLTIAIVVAGLCVGVANAIRLRVNPLEELKPAGQSFGHVLVAILLSGGVVYLLRVANFVSVIGFEPIGVFTATFLLAAVAVLTWTIFRQALTRTARH